MMRKLIVIIVSFLFFFSAIAVQPAYSRGGGGGSCFSKETLILTPDGEKTIDRLRCQDRVIGYNFSTKHQAVGTIEDVREISAPDYYLINNRIKVTATHPFYVQTVTGIRLIEVADLKLGDRLIGRDNLFVNIFSIEHINKPLTVYNLISIDPNHNFYADGILVHNKGGGGGGGGSGYYRFGGGGGSSNTMAFTEKVFWGLIKALLFLIMGILPVLYWRQLYNFVFYRNKQLTTDKKLIKFASAINYEFKNAYSMSYRKDNQIWLQEKPQVETKEAKYNCVISKEILVEQVRCLFDRYQQDWTNKDFRAIEQYTFEPFKSQQREIYHQSCGENIDIVYDCQLSAVVPIQFEMREDLKRFVMQINGQMINFKISPRGYVISGKSEHRLFTEYWDVALDAENKCYLVIIHQVQP